jgi:hypothetical protein
MRMRTCGGRLRTLRTATPSGGPTPPLPLPSRAAPLLRRASAGRLADRMDCPCGYKARASPPANPKPGATQPGNQRTRVGAVPLIAPPRPPRRGLMRRSSGSARARLGRGAASLRRVARAVPAVPVLPAGGSQRRVAWGWFGAVPLFVRWSGPEARVPRRAWAAGGPACTAPGSAAARPLAEVQV